MLATVQSHLGTAALMLGAIAGFLALVDLSISTATRNRIKDASTRVWYWLTYQRTWPYVRALQQPRSFDVFCGLGASSVMVLVWVIYLRLIAPSDWTWGFLGAFLVPPAVAVGVYSIWRNSLRKLFGLVTKANAAWEMLLRGFAAYVPIQVGAYALVQTGAPLMRYVLSLIPMHDFSRLELLQNRDFVVFFFLVLVTALAAYFSFFLLFALMLLFLYISSIYALILIFRCSEFVALKLAEYEKGPVLAAAAALTAFGSILKAFGTS